MLISMNIKSENTVCEICKSDNISITGGGYDYEFKTSGNYWRTCCCNQCGHLYLNPRPKVSEAKKIYPDNYYPAPDFSSWNTKFINRIRYFIERSRYANLSKYVTPEPCFVDIGAGDGRVLGYFRKIFSSNARLVAVDFSVDPKTKQYFDNQSIEYVEGIAENIDFEKIGVRADAVLLTQVIEHLWSPDVVLKKLVGVMKDSGVMFIETPNPNSFCMKFQGSKYWGGWHRPRHLNVFSKESLVTLANRAGLNLVEYSQFTVPAFWIMGFRNRRGIPTYSTDSGWNKIVSIRSLPALIFFTLLEHIVGIFGLGRSNHRFVFIKQHEKKCVR